MAERILLLGCTGKMGTALQGVFGTDYEVVGKSSRDFDALNFHEVRSLIEESSPDIVMNTVALLGIDPCEREPERALRLNTLYPRLLAELSNEKDFLLVHFSTDAIFNDRKGDFCTESDHACPLNLYGLTKYGGDCFVQNISRRYYIFRVSVLFGETSKSTQFVEKMLDKIRGGERVLRVSDDIVLSPTYSRDVARVVRTAVETGLEFGLFHVANRGKASLYDLMKEIVGNLGLDVRVEGASHRDFPAHGIKNTFTPIKSEKLESLRAWKEAVREYCENLKSMNTGE